MGRDIRSSIALYLGKGTFGTEKLPEELEVENEGLKILFAISVDSWARLGVKAHFCNGGPPRRPQDLRKLMVENETTKKREKLRWLADGSRIQRTKELFGAASCHVLALRLGERS